MAHIDTRVGTRVRDYYGRTGVIIGIGVALSRGDDRQRYFLVRLDCVLQTRSGGGPLQRYYVMAYLPRYIYVINEEEEEDEDED